MTRRYSMLARIALDSALAATAIWIVLYMLSYEPPPWRLFGIVLIYALAIAAPAHVILGRMFPIDWGGPGVQWSLFVATLALIAVAGSVAATLIVLGLGLEAGVPASALLSRSLRLSVFLALLIGIVQAMLQRLRDRLGLAEKRLQEQAVAHERALKLASEARLAALEARVHPHFLFNALNTVSSLIPHAPDHAERLVEQMAAVLRFALETHKNGLVRVDQEMKIVRDYLDIERARFGNRLQYTIDVDSSLDAVCVPPFAVQTLVENSVRHGIAADRRGGSIRVHARREGAFVRFEVADTGPGFSADGIPPGHGLDNLRGRLAGVVRRDP